MLTVGVPVEVTPGERRVALTPDAVQRLTAQGIGVLVEPGAGAAAWYADEQYLEAGARLGDPYTARVVVKVAAPTEDEVRRLAEGTVLVGLLDPQGQPDRNDLLAARGVIAFALESVPRISRAQTMDALSSQANLAGYRAVLEAAVVAPRLFPMLTTAAGTVPPARVLVLGVGVAGLQAIATARRLGARTTGYDVRPEVAEQVRSLGADWLDLGVAADGDGGYARALDEEERARQQAELEARISGFDVVVTTALVPGRRAPVLVTEESVRGMAPGSVIVDLAGATGGNCELTEPGRTVERFGVTIVSPLHPASAVAMQASRLYARNVESFLELLVEDGRLSLDLDDEILAASCVTPSR